MPLAASNLTSGSATATSSTATGAYSVAANALGLLTVINSDGSSNQQPTTPTGFALVATANLTSAGTPAFVRCTIFRQLAAGGFSGPTTLDFGGVSQTAVIWSVDQITGVSTAGTNGSGAINQSNTATQTGTNFFFTISLPSAPTGMTFVSIGGDGEAFGGNGVATTATNYTSLSSIGSVATNWGSSVMYKNPGTQSPANITARGGVAGVILDIIGPSSIFIDEGVFQNDIKARSWQRRDATAKGYDGIDQILLQPTRWETALQNFQPPHPKPERFGALARGDDGNENTFTQWFNGGWEVQPPQPPHPRPEKSASYLRGDDGIEAPYILVITAVPDGWEVQPPQPPVYPTTKQKAAGFLRGDDGTEGIFVQWYNNGWEIQPPQPPHIPQNRAAAFLIGDVGHYNPSPWFNMGWEIQPPQPPHIPQNRAAAFLIGDPGNEKPFVQWYNNGWEVQPPQPPHPRPERFGALARGDDGNQNYPTQFIDGWRIQDFQPPFKPSYQKAAGFMVADPGHYNPLPLRYLGWDIQLPQPPHIPQNRAAAFMPSISIEGLYIVPFVPLAREEYNIFPRVPREKRAAAIMRGDDGNQAKRILEFQNAYITLPIIRYMREQHVGGILPASFEVYLPPLTVNHLLRNTIIRTRILASPPGRP